MISFAFVVKFVLYLVCCIVAKYENINLISLSILSRNPGQKAEVSLRLSEAVLALKESGEGEIPKQHRLDVTTVTRQMLGVFSHVARKSHKISKFKIFFRNIFIVNFAASASSDAIVPETEKLFMEGRIVQKLECRPYGTSSFVCVCVCVSKDIFFM